MKPTPANINYEIGVICNTLQTYSYGATIEDIEKSTGLSLQRRTLLRRLTKMIAQGLVESNGRPGATFYQLVQQVPYYSPGVFGNVLHDESTPSIPLTQEGMDVLRRISQPITMRKPVGYNTDFLVSYRPNIDSYLSAIELEKLAGLGKTTAINQLPGTYAKEILQRLLIDLSWNSSRLEDNTYSLLDTHLLIADGKTADNKSVLESQMILNHKYAIQFLVQSPYDIKFDRFTITNLHAILADNLLDNEARGRLRTIMVGIGASVYTPLTIPQQVEEMFNIILAKVNAIKNPFEQAFFLMVHLPYLQPFDDVNKRVSRLAANISLNQHNLSPLSFVEVDRDMYLKGTLGVYELNRVDLLKDVFMWAYERSAARYATIRQTVKAPALFKFRYTREIHSLITHIVSNAMTIQQANDYIKQASKQFPLKDQQKFMEYVDTELLSLNDNTFAMYFIPPTAYEQWKKKWGKL
ncbi:Fic family protein [Chitinophaga skermanii]|uniref:Fic family protein n=1 Tax=Chitinophaga skermanii TaxID=331697 RepID=A0A327QLT0_9BACT|nr:Fic family protein [Chitinophaga skermanii]RAJ04303.1 Fic family protein [Chitinophaga skermanii]